MWGRIKKTSLSLVAWSWHHPKKVFIIAFLLSCGAFLGVQQLTLNTQANQLLPQDMPSLQEYRQGTADFGHQSLFVAMVALPEVEQLDLYRHFLVSYKQRLQQAVNPQSNQFSISADILQRVSQYVSKYGLYLFDVQQLQQFNQLLSPKSLKSHLQERAYLSAEPFFDPLGLMPLLEAHFLPSQELMPDPSGEFLISRDRRFAFLAMNQAMAPGDIARTSKLLQQIAQIERELRSGYNSSERRIIDSLRVRWTGLPLMLHGDHLALKHFAWSSLLISFVMIVLLFYGVFRRFASVLVAFIPLLLALLWTFGLAGFTLGSLNIATAALGAILIALGIDYPAYLLFAYRSRARSLQGLALIEAVWVERAATVFLGALSSAVAFLVLVGTQLSAFRQLGFIAGMGLLVTVLTVLFVMPALLRFLHDMGAAKPRTVGLPVMKWALAHPKMITGIFIVLVSGFIYSAQTVEIGLSLQSTHAESSEAQQVATRIEEVLQIDLNPVRVIVNAPELYQALFYNEQLGRELELFKSQGLIQQYDSLSRWIPSPQRRKQITQMLNQSNNLQPELFQENFSAVVQELDLSGSAYSRYQKIISRGLRSRQQPTLQTMKRLGLEEIVGKYQAQRPYQTRLITNIYLPKSIEGERERSEIISQLESLSSLNLGQVQLLSEVPIFEEMALLIKQELRWILLLGLAVVLLVLCLTFRSILLSLIAIIPMLFAILATAACYTLGFGRINGVNLFFFIVLIGLAIDDAVHYIRAWQRAGGDNQALELALEQVSAPIIFTSVTTIFGFGTLVLSPFPVSQQAGLLVLLAMLWELVASLLLLPVLLKFFVKLRAEF